MTGAWAKTLHQSLVEQHEINGHHVDTVIVVTTAKTGRIVI
jgi:hypothetical protein